MGMVTFEEDVTSIHEPFHNIITIQGGGVNIYKKKKEKAIYREGGRMPP